MVDQPEILNPNPVVASSGPGPEGAPSPSGVVDGALPPAVSQAVPADSSPKLAESMLGGFLKERDAAAAAAKAMEPATPSPDAAKPDPAADAKPAEAGKVDAKPADPAAPVVPVEPAAPAPVEYAYTLPETITLGEGDKEKVTAAFDAFRADPAKGSQALIDLHNERMTAYADSLLQKQYETFNDTRRGWQREVMSDPDIGGSGHRTAMGVIARMRDMFVSEKRREGFEKMLEVTGVGDHPEFLHFVRNVGRAFDEAPLPPSNPKPTPSQGLSERRRLRDTYNR